MQSGGFPGAGLKTTDLDQYFSNLSWGPPITPHFVCLPHLTHMIQLISSLVETTRPEVSDKGDIQNVQCRGAPRTRLKTPGLGP